LRQHFFRQMNSTTILNKKRGLRASIPLLCVLAALYGCGGGGNGTGSATGGSAGGAPGSGSGTNVPPGSSTPGGTPPDVTTAAALDFALTSGNSSNVSLANVMTAAQSLLSTQVTAYSSIRQTIFSGVGAIDWDPSHDSGYFTLQDSTRNFVILPSNWKYNGNAAGTSVGLGVAGTAPGSNARYAAFGGNPLGVPGNTAMDKFMTNTVGWLTGGTNSAGVKVVVSQMPGTETYWFPHEKKVRDWFYAKYPGATINGALASGTQSDNVCDGAALAGCLQGANLLVIGSEQGPGAYSGDVVIKAVSDAQAHGIPVLYLNHHDDDGDLAIRLATYFGLKHNTNYWGDEGLKAFDPATLPAVPAQLASTQDLLSRLDKGTFSTTWSGCTTDVGRTSCDNDTTYMSEFGTVSAQIRNALRQLDADGKQLFALPGYQLEKLLVLLGDKYRENIVYPMDKTDNKQDFFRAYFADSTAYITRGSSAVSKGLGNFAPAIPVTTPTISQTVTVTLPTTGTKEYLTGLYVIPDKKITLTRTDNGVGVVRFGMNILRDSTRLFDERYRKQNKVDIKIPQYDRPTNISSPRPALMANKPVSITSPYGGPLMLFIDAAGSGNQQVTVQVDGVITHPVLRNPNDPTAVAAFQSDVNTTITNWVGFTSDTLTIHSTVGNFKETLANYNGNMSAFAADTFKYTIKDTYELAGFNSSSGQLSLASTVNAFCNSKGWDCTGTQHRRDTMQQVISDVHAQCGDGCSGNPYDQDWAFDPLGWGESHEIGHNLQVSRLKIYNGMSTEVSNNIFPMHKQIKYNTTPAGLTSPIVARQNAGSDVFTVIRNALGTPDPTASMYTSSWSDDKYAANNNVRVMFYRQLPEFARYYNSQFQDGWELYTLLYLLDRNFGQASSTWSSKASSYGFGTYATYPSSMSGNDFMLIATSNIIGRDMGPVFAMWGITTSAAAKAQVTAYGFPPAQALYFPMYDVDATPAKVGTPINMTSSAVYPAGY